MDLINRSTRATTTYFLHKAHSAKRVFQLMSSMVWGDMSISRRTGNYIAFHSKSVQCRWSVFIYFKPFATVLQFDFHDRSFMFIANRSRTGIFAHEKCSEKIMKYFLKRMGPQKLHHERTYFLWHLKSFRRWHLAEQKRHFELRCRARARKRMR